MILSHIDVSRSLPVSLKSIKYPQVRLKKQMRIITPHPPTSETREQTERCHLGSLRWAAGVGRIREDEARE